MDSRRDQVRNAVLRAARCWPQASTAELAHRVGCHPSTVTRHLAELRHRDRHRTQVVLGYEETNDTERASLRASGTNHSVIALRDASLVATAARQREQDSSLSAFADNPDPLVRAALCANPSCPKYLLTRLAADTSAWVRAAAAAHPDCPPEARRFASRHGYWPEVTSHGAAAAAALRARLASSSEWGARRAVAAHPDSDGRLLVRLARDPHPTVRAAVAAREGCPPHLLARLVHDPHPAVKTAATARRTRQTGLMVVPKSREPAD